MTPIDHVLNRLSTCLKWSRGSPVNHFREMTDVSKVVIRGKRVKHIYQEKFDICNVEVVASQSHQSAVSSPGN